MSSEQQYPASARTRTAGGGFSQGPPDWMQDIPIEIYEAEMPPARFQDGRDRPRGRLGPADRRADRRARAERCEERGQEREPHRVRPSLPGLEAAQVPGQGRAQDQPRDRTPAEARQAPRPAQPVQPGVRRTGPAGGGVPSAAASVGTEAADPHASAGSAVAASAAGKTGPAAQAGPPLQAESAVLPGSAVPDRTQGQDMQDSRAARAVPRAAAAGAGDSAPESALQGSVEQGGWASAGAFLPGGSDLPGLVPGPRRRGRRQEPPPRRWQDLRHEFWKKKRITEPEPVSPDAVVRAPRPEVREEAEWRRRSWEELRELRFPGGLPGSAPERPSGGADAGTAGRRPEGERPEGERPQGRPGRKPVWSGAGWHMEQTAGRE